MKATITVKDRAEAKALQIGLDHSTVRAFAVIAGTLLQLPSERERAMVLSFVMESLAPAGPYAGHHLPDEQ